MKIVFLFLILCLGKTLSSNRWPNHDISTLKLLQIVHRHGDRTPIGAPPNDPFQSQSYWPEGFGQLTTKGKYRLYKTGQFIRQEYEQYLGDKYSPREVYARSGLSDRCIESLSCLLAGAYPPNPKLWQWNNGSDAKLGLIWQPFPIETFMPNDEDVVLEQDKHCPAVDRERDMIYNRTDLRKFVEDNHKLYANLTKITGKSVFDIMSASSLLGTLRVETDHNYYWTKIWTKEEEDNIVKQLSKANSLRYRYNWDSPIIQRLSTGGLVKELIKNFKAVLNNEKAKKIYVYSTHDTMLAALMHSLNIFNDSPPPFGAALLLELHEKMDSQSKKYNYFVRVFYHNETVINSGTPHPIQWKNSHNLYDCPIDQFFNSTNHLLYENIDKECNQ